MRAAASLGEATSSFGRGGGNTKRGWFGRGTCPRLNPNLSPVLEHKRRASCPRQFLALSEAFLTLNFSNHHPLSSSFPSTRLYLARFRRLCSVFTMKFGLPHTTPSLASWAVLLSFGLTAMADFDLYSVTISGNPSQEMWLILEGDSNCDRVTHTRLWPASGDVSGGKTGVRCGGRGCWGADPAEIDVLEMHFTNNPLFHWSKRFCPLLPRRRCPPSHLNLNPSRHVSATTTGALSWGGEHIALWRRRRFVVVRRGGGVLVEVE